MKFPHAVITTTRSTRQQMFHKDFEITKQWTHDYDWDDFVEIWHHDGNMPLFFKLINTFLLIIKYDNDKDKQIFNEYITEILNYGSEYEFTKTMIIKQLIEQIKTLYSTMQLFPVASKLITNEIILYHGSDSIRYQSIRQELLALQADDIFELPMFMSTSIISDVACRFARISKIILKIRIKEDKLREFYYSFFGETIILEDNTSFSENEILLKLFTKLQFKSITKDVSLTFKVPQINGSTIESTGVFTIIEMEFIGNPSKTPESVKNFLQTESRKYFTTSSGKNKKKYKKFYTQKLAIKTNVKQSKKQSKKKYRKKTGIKKSKHLNTIKIK